MQNAGSIISCDIHVHKTALIEKGAARLGIDIIQAMQLDAREKKQEFLGRFDAVIADVPCSGLGVIRKKPDIRYKDLAPLQALQHLHGIEARKRGCGARIFVHASGVLTGIGGTAGKASA